MLRPNCFCPNGFCPTTGVPTELVLYPGEGHGWRRPANQLDGDQRVLRWFTKYLLHDGKARDGADGQQQAKL